MSTQSLILILILFARISFAQDTTHAAPAPQNPQGSTTAKFPPGGGTELSIIGGYDFGDKYDINYGTARVNDNPYIEATFSFPIKAIVNLELTYMYEPGSMDVNVAPPDNHEGLNTDFHHFLLGTVKTIRTSYPVVPYIGLKLGAVLADPKEIYESLWLFDTQLVGGIKYFFKPNIGLKLQLQLTMPMQGAGVGFSAGTGGAGFGVSTFTTITLFGTGGGLVFAF